MTAQVLDGTVGQIISTSGDSLVGLDSRYASPPDVQWPLTFGNMAANVMLPLTYPNYTPEVRPFSRPDASPCAGALQVSRPADQIWR